MSFNDKRLTTMPGRTAGRRAWRSGMMFAAMTCLTGCGVEPQDATWRETRPLMGTLVEIQAEGPGEHRLRSAVRASYLEMYRLIKILSHYDPASVVSEVNRQAGTRPVTVPPELREVLTMARRVSVRSGGAFDITVGALKGWRFDSRHPRMPSPEEIRAQLPQVDYRRVRLDEAAGTVFLERPGMRLDLGGIAKLYILDAGMKTLIRHGIERALINGGGDVLVMSRSEDRPWRIGIRHPRREGELLGVIALERGLIVSSGDYERYFIRDGKRFHHILDPRTGYPAEGPHHVTLVADDLEAVNGLSAAIMVRGAAWGRALITQTPGLEGLIIDCDGTLWISPGLSFRPISSARGATAR